MLGPFPLGNSLSEGGLWGSPSNEGGEQPVIDSAWSPVALAAVTIDDRFWAPWQRINREYTLPTQYEQLRQTGRLDALRLNWQPGQQPVPHIFWESDIAKWIEAASYSLVTHPDAALQGQVDEAIALLAAAQQPDGYLNVYFTVVKPGQRWTDLRDAHELYCAGHLIEAGVAHFQATGQRTLLDVVCRYADYIGGVFGTAPGQKRGYCGHEEIELALVKLYRVTGQHEYLRLSQYFVDERGQQPFYFDLEAAQRGTPGYFEAHLQAPRDLRRAREYHQAHAPVREQREVVGHAVRAMYLYAAMADLVAESGDETLREACRRLWEHLGSRRLYITGGLGPAAENEGFTSDYDLPNETAYAETCAAIGLVFWAQRMVNLEGEGRYGDVLEQALYNGALSGMSADGRRYFYANPLASQGDRHRQEWFDCACCPPNLARLLASLGGYLYSTRGDEVAVHLYVQSTVRLSMGGQELTLRQVTDYPWQGAVRLTVALAQPATFGLRLRLPGWSQGARLRVNGQAVDLAGAVTAGYARVEREWREGDEVELELPMPVQRVYAHPRVRQDAGKVALRRGPLVYCVEEADVPAEPGRVVLPRDAALQARFEASLLDGVVVVSGAALAADVGGWDGQLYREAAPELRPLELRAVPYYAWDNRQPGQMRVWLGEGVATDAAQ